MAWEIKKVALKVIDNNKTVDKLFFFGCPGTVQKSGVRYDNTSFGVSKLRMQEIECIQMKFSILQNGIMAKWWKFWLSESDFWKKCPCKDFWIFLSPNLKLYHHSVSNPFRQSAVSTVHRANLEECSSISIQFILFS